MLSYALIANGQHNPYLATPLPEHMIYPISQRCDNGIDLDYSALVLGDRFIIDSAVFEDVMYSRKEYFAPMKRSFRELSACGLLEKRDYSAFFDKNQKKIIDVTNTLLENTEVWLKLEQVQWSTLKDELLEFQGTFGSQSMCHHNISNIGIESWLARSDQMFNQKLRNDLYLLFEGKKKIEDVGIENVRGSLEFIVAQIVMSDLISHSVGAPVLDWDDSKGLYERVYSTRWNNYEAEVQLQKESRKLLNIVVPDLKPDNIYEVIRFISDNKAVQSLRNMLMELINNGETVSNEWMTQYLCELNKAGIALQRKSSVFQFFGSIAGLFTGTWYQDIALNGAASVVDQLLFHPDRKYDWYYALMKKG